MGTSAGVPTRSRNVSSVALRHVQRGEVWLFDCGEATQHQLLRSDLRISQITRVFVTHMHGDHVFGLPGLLATCGMAGHARRIDVYGPRGLAEYFEATAALSQTRFSYPVEVHTVESAGVVFEDEDYKVECAPLRHRVRAFGYRVTERDRAGRFDVERARSLGVPEGPLYGRLKRGERVTLADGRTVEGAELTGPPERGRKLAYCTDTVYCRASVELARDADLLIHEATFASADAELARQSMHSTASDAARVAAEAGARRLVITHFSPRYVEVNPVTTQDLLAEARAVFPATEAARDFLTVAVPRRN